MGKIRIYELAKELGVDNRAVILKAQELGMPGKLSHSNSLEDDEADQLRRAFIRAAVTESEKKKPMECNTTRVVKRHLDSLTGEVQTIIESRKGNVVKRRKQTDIASSDKKPIDVVPEQTDTQQDEPKVSNISTDEDILFEDSKNQNTLTEKIQVTDFEKIDEELEESHVQDAQQQSEISSIAVQETEQTAIVNVPVVDEESYLEFDTSDKETSDAESTTEPEAVTEPIEEDEFEEEDGNMPEPTSQHAEEEIEELQVKNEPLLIQKVEKKSFSGPKILGKIDLPQKKKKFEKDKDKDKDREKEKDREKDKDRNKADKVPSRNFYDDSMDDDDDDGETRIGKKRSKKKEYTRGQLIDYDGRGNKRRTNKNIKTKADQPIENAVPVVETQPQKASKRVVKMASDIITVGELARQMSLKVAEVISKLMQLGVMATINQSVDTDTATIVADEFGYTLEFTGFDEEEILTLNDDNDVTHLALRPPVVTVMGHVDHGKTSLLDTIRKTSVAAKEHGGITQHVGAYKVKLPDGRFVVFIDTPGHAAFTQMRARGAEVTDIVVIVVAADDGVMPQTIEAINHAKAANVTICVAINKMDKPTANPDKVKQQLAEQGLQPEDWGGDVMMFPVSALTGAGVPELLEGLLLLAEMKELKANNVGKAKGTIIEARQERGRGTVVTLLVQSGLLKIGDIYVCGTEYGRVRSLYDDRQKKINEAGPSNPVELSGLNGVPMAGDDFIVVESEHQAKQIATNRKQRRMAKEQLSLAGGPISLEEFAKRAGQAQALELNIIIKTDVHGTLEAIKDSVEKLSTAKVKVCVLHGGVGGITESDVQLAAASKAIIVGFGVRADQRVIAEAESNGVELRFYRVIYELLDDVKAAMAGLLEPVKKETTIATVEVRDTFVVPKIGTIAGCYVNSGTVKRGALLRLLRDNVVIHEGKMLSLRRFKDDVKEVQSGYECGISFVSYNDIKVGDNIEVYEIEEIAATLE